MCVCVCLDGAGEERRQKEVLREARLARGEEEFHRR